MRLRKRAREWHKNGEDEYQCYDVVSSAERAPYADISTAKNRVFQSQLSALPSSSRTIPAASPANCSIAENSRCFVTHFCAAAAQVLRNSLKSLRNGGELAFGAEEGRKEERERARMGCKLEIAKGKQVSDIRISTTVYVQLNSWYCSLLVGFARRCFIIHRS